MAREIVVGKDGKAEAVSYIDKATKYRKARQAKAFVVAASACESARLLLNSRSTSVSRRSGKFFRRGGPLFDRLCRQLLAMDISHSWKRCRRTITTALAACTCTFRGGSSIARMISFAAITSSLVADAICRAWVSSMTSART